jgi:hypothetical protein
MCGAMVQCFVRLLASKATEKEELTMKCRLINDPH